MVEEDTLKKIKTLMDILKAVKPEDRSEWESRLESSVRDYVVIDNELGINRSITEILDDPRYESLKPEFEDYLQNEVIGGMRGMLLNMYDSVSYSLSKLESILAPGAHANFKDLIKEGVTGRLVVIPYAVAHILYKVAHIGLGNAAGLYEDPLKNPDYYGDIARVEAKGTFGLILPPKSLDDKIFELEAGVENRVQLIASAWLRNRIRSINGLDPVYVRKDLPGFLKEGIAGGYKISPGYTGLAEYESAPIYGMDFQYSH